MGKAVLKVVLLLIWLGWHVAEASAATPATVRIWPLGDSITEGCCLAIGGGYRTELEALLSNAGYNVDFVGTLQDANPPPTLLDPDHDGHAGYRIDEIDAGLDGWASLIDDPDVVLLHLGTNDAAQNYNMASAPNRLENLIGHIAAHFPYAKILVASIIVAADPTVESRVETYNSSIPAVVNNEAALGAQAYFINVHGCCVVADLSDTIHGLHPNSTGYQKMATNWFAGVTAVISPTGTTNRPAIARIQGATDLKHVEVVFSKPVDDTSATLAANYALDGGLSVLQASLDTTKRVVTLTTSAQTIDTTYGLTVNGVSDRTAQQNPILPGTIATFVSKPIAEAADYSLVYSLRLPTQANYNTDGVPYDVDDHAVIGAFSRVAYYLELQPIGGGPLQYVWASMDAFTTDAGKIGVPVIQTGAFFQQLVTNLNVRSSVASIVTGDGLSSGNMEFWWGNYGKSNADGVPNASNTLYDFGDSASPSDPAGYGSMQIHNWAAGQTIFAFNGWGESPQIADLGIGNNSGTYPDWTFASNAGNYSAKVLRVYALPVRILTINSSNPASGVNIRIAPRDENGAANGATSLNRTYVKGTVVNLAAPTMVNGNTFQKWQRNGIDFGNSPRATLTVDDNMTLTAIYVPTRVLTVNSSNPGSGVNIRLGPIDNNGEGDGQTDISRLYGDGSVVNLAAALKSGGNNFQKWQKDGVDYSSSYRISLVLHSSSTLTAVYTTPPP